MFEKKSRSITPLHGPENRLSPESSQRPSLEELTPPNANSHRLLDIEMNVSKALEQRRAIRTLDYRSAKTESLRNNVIGGSLLGGAAASLLLAPLIPFEHPIANVYAALSIVVGIASAIHASRIISAASAERHRSESADKRESSEDFERAEAARRDPTSKAELATAGRRYLALLDDVHGAPIIAKSLVGFADCIIQLGITSPESARLMRDIDESLSPNYTALPVQRLLGQIALDHVRELAEHLPEGTERHRLARSVARLARIGWREHRAEALTTATEIYQIARALPASEPVMRAELLGAGFALTRNTDPIRENIENFLREIFHSLPLETEPQLHEYDHVGTILERYDIEL